MLYDTDVLIWALRGNTRAAKAIDDEELLEISAVSYMELIKGARNKKDLRLTKAFLGDLGFCIVPLSENIGHRAAIYLEEYGLKSGLGVPDALIAATAVETDAVLCTGNARDYKSVAQMRLKLFRP